ncbi:MAG: hypothetical protein Q4F23_00870 [Coriobacteriia bacterium]|nr:hypothetical protein [Coriobacteriia bacterium]
MSADHHQVIDSSNYRSFSNDQTLAFLDSLQDRLVEIEDSNGSSFYEKADVRVGVITDSFMYNYYADAVDLVYLRPSDFEDKLEGLDFVLYISCWHGLSKLGEDGLYEWRPAAAVEVVPQLFGRARALGIPSVFQTIEDPPSYEMYLPIAKAADVIFTSAVEKIQTYVKDTGNPYVYYLPYGVNPQIHNPIGFLKRRARIVSPQESAAFFAGSWYASYPDRCEDTRLLFDEVTKTLGLPLVVADRALGFPYRTGRVFPEEYNEYIVPAFEHKLLQKVHKLFDYALNLNSIKRSETMGAMRVFEVQALGSLLISNDALSTRNQFPDMCIVGGLGDAKDYFDGMTTQELVRRQLLGIRAMMSKASVYGRLNYMFEKLDLAFRFVDKPVYVLHEPGNSEAIAAFERQTYANKCLVSFDQRELLVGSEGFFVLFDGSEENPYFLEDALNAFKFVDVDYVNYVDSSDYARGYDYTRGTQSYVGTVYSLKRVKTSDFDSQIEGKDMLGFSIIPCCE